MDETITTVATATGQQSCVSCGRTYEADDVPTIAQGCPEDCEQFGIEGN